MTDVLVLTATIAPKVSSTHLAHTDPEKRLADYIAAFSFYARQVAAGTFSHVVFIDNSGHPLTALQQVAADAGILDRTSFVSFDREAPASVGRFALELDLLIEAFRREPLVSMDAATRYWKVTGRYVVRNIRTLVATAPLDADFYVNSREYPRAWTDFYVAAFNRVGFERVLADDAASYQNLRSGEEVLRARIDGGVDGVRIAPRLKRIPRLSGIRGYDGRRYDGAGYRLKYTARVLVDRLFPSLWV